MPGPELEAEEVLEGAGDPLAPVVGGHPGGSPSNTSPGGACSPDATNTPAPAQPSPNTAHASVCHGALLQRVFDTSAYHRSHAPRRPTTSRSPMPVTRTSLPGGAVV